MLVLGKMTHQIITYVWVHNVSTKICIHLFYNSVRATRKTKIAQRILNLDIKYKLFKYFSENMGKARHILIILRYYERVWPSECGEALIKS